MAGVWLVGKTPGARTGNLPYLGEAGSNTFLDLNTNKQNQNTSIRKRIILHSRLPCFKTKKKFRPPGCQLVAEQLAGDAGISFFGDNDKSKYVDGWRGLVSKLKDGFILGRKHHQKDEFISRMLWSVLACAWPLRVWALVGWWVGGSKKAPQETDLTLSLSNNWESAWPRNYWTWMKYFVRIFLPSTVLCVNKLWFCHICVTFTFRTFLQRLRWIEFVGLRLIYVGVWPLEVCISWAGGVTCGCLWVVCAFVSRGCLNPGSLGWVDLPQPAVGGRNTIQNICTLLQTSKKSGAGWWLIIS